MNEIRFLCPNCGQSLEAPMDMAGETVECPTCTKGIDVPLSSGPSRPTNSSATRKPYVKTILITCAAGIVIGLGVSFWWFGQNPDQVPSDSTPNTEQALSQTAMSDASNRRVEGRRPATSIPEGINSVGWGATIDLVQSNTVALSRSGTLGQTLYPRGWPIEYAICLVVGANKTVFGTTYTLDGAYMPQYLRYTRARSQRDRFSYGTQSNTDKGDETPYDLTVFLFTATNTFAGYYSIVNANNEETLLADLNWSYGTRATRLARLDTKHVFPGGASEPFFVEGWKWEDNRSVVFLVRFSESQSKYYLGLFKFSRSFVESVDEIRAAWIKGIRDSEKSERERIKKKADGDLQRDRLLF